MRFLVKTISLMRLFGLTRDGLILKWDFRMPIKLSFSTPKASLLSSICFLQIILQRQILTKFFKSEKEICLVKLYTKKILKEKLLGQQIRKEYLYLMYGISLFLILKLKNVVVIQLKSLLNYSRKL